MAGGDRIGCVALAEVAYTQRQIAERVAELAESIRDEMTGHRPLLVSVLDGSVMFLADLVRALKVDCDIDFLSVSSYPGKPEAAGVVRIIKDLEFLLEGRRVVLIEDIVDTGLTLAFLLRTLEARNPHSLSVCTLVNKPVRRIAQPPIDYSGFETDKFLVGYGLDFQGRYRNLPYMLGIKDVPALVQDPSGLDALSSFSAG